MLEEPSHGQLFRVNEECRRGEGDFFLIAVPSKRIPRPIEKNKASGFWITKLNKTKFFDEEKHFEEELVLIKSTVSKISLKDLKQEVFLLPFYFFLRTHLDQKKPNDNESGSPVEETDAWEKTQEKAGEDSKLPEDDYRISNHSLDISHPTPQGRKGAFTIRLMILKNRLMSLEDGLPSGKNATICSIQAFFGPFMKAFALDESTQEGKTTRKIERRGLSTNDLILKFQEFTNPACRCSSEGFGPEDHLIVCQCGRIYHQKCSDKPQFVCQKCAQDRIGLVSLGKRDDSEFRLEDVDFSKDLRKYQKEFGVRSKRTILKTSREIRNLRKIQKSKKQSLRESRQTGKSFVDAIEIDVKKQSKATQLIKLVSNSEILKSLCLEDKVLRLFELWRVDYYEFGRKDKPIRKRENVTGLCYKALALGICEVMDDLRDYDRFLKRAKQNVGKRKHQRSIKNIENMKREEPRVVAFLKCLYESGILQGLKDGGEKQLVEYLADMANKIEIRLFQKYLIAGERYQEGKYFTHAKMLFLNLNQRHSKFLRYKIISKQLTFKEISKLEEEDLISDELKRKIEESKEEFWKEREVNRELKYIIKNHKGDIEMEFKDKENEILAENLKDLEQYEVPKKKILQPLIKADFIEVHVQTYRNKLQHKIRGTELVFFDLKKQNTNEIIELQQPKVITPRNNKTKETNLKIGKEDQDQYNSLSTVSEIFKGILPELKKAQNKKIENGFANGKNRSRFDNSKNKEDKNSNHKKSDKMKFKDFSPRKLGKRMQIRILKTLKPETVKNIKEMLGDIIPARN